MADQPIEGVRLLVTGQVQGVGFRYFALQAARQRGVTGWARNLADGRVELEAWGAAEVLASFEAQIGQGPRFSKVAKVDRIERRSIESESPVTFEIRR